MTQLFSLIFQSDIPENYVVLSKYILLVHFYLNPSELWITQVIIDTDNRLDQGISITIW